MRKRSGPAERLLQLRQEDECPELDYGAAGERRDEKEERAAAAHVKGAGRHKTQMPVSTL